MFIFTDVKIYIYIYMRTKLRQLRLAWLAYLGKYA